MEEASENLAVGQGSPAARAIRRQRLQDAWADIPLAYRLVGEATAVVSALFLGNLLLTLVQPGIAPAIADKDFANYWLAAHLAAAGDVRAVFAPEPVYLAHLRDVFGPQMPWHNWSYPPHYLLLMMPLALLPYKVGLVAFASTTGALFWAALRSFCAKSSALFLLVASAPFLLLNLWVVQNGFLTGALALGALRFRAERPLLAGLFLGLLTVKPQLGFLLPLVMLAERRWRVLASAALTAGLAVLFSSLLFGASAWHAYFATVLPYQGQIAASLGGTFLTMLPSIFGAARFYGVAPDMALALHLAVAVPIGIITVLALFLASSDQTRGQVVLVATFLITPYSLNYDLGLLVGAITSFIQQGGDGGRRSDRVVLALAMMLPPAMMILGRLCHLAIAPPLLLLVFMLILRHAAIGERLPAWRMIPLRTPRSLTAPRGGRAGAGAARSA